MHFPVHNLERDPEIYKNQYEVWHISQSITDDPPAKENESQ